MPQQIAAGAKQNGQYNVKLAEALYSYGMYPEAEAAAKLAMSKGGITDPSEAPMVLGQALTAQGKYADAVTAFAASDRRRSRHRAHHPAVGGLRQGQAESARGAAAQRRRIKRIRAGRAKRPALFLSEPKPIRAEA